MCATLKPPHLKGSEENQLAACLQLARAVRCCPLLEGVKRK